MRDFKPTSGTCFQVLTPSGIPLFALLPSGPLHNGPAMLCGPFFFSIGLGARARPPLTSSLPLPLLRCTRLVPQRPYAGFQRHSRIVVSHF